VPPHHGLFHVAEHTTAFAKAIISQNQTVLEPPTVWPLHWLMIYCTDLHMYTLHIIDDYDYLFQDNLVALVVGGSYLGV
jgi:hypothetical protein